MNSPRRKQRGITGRMVGLRADCPKLRLLKESQASKAVNRASPEVSDL
jgi:hypothetical protein